MRDYEYVPLSDPANWIRLFKLLPIRDDDGRTLRGELITCRRDEAPPYSPVSYTWGQQNASSTLLLRDWGDANCGCDGSGSANKPSPGDVPQPTPSTDTCSILTSRPTQIDVPTPDLECKHTIWRRFPIRPNLEALLRRFSRLSEPKVFWVDAICIDQGNNHEKGHQVRNMDKIYKGRDLLIWLGEPTANSDLAIDLTEAFAGGWGPDVSNTPEKLQALRNFFDTSLRHSPSWKTFVDLIRRPWFTRRWIVQEFVLSNHKYAFIGDREFCFRPVIGLCLHFQRLPGLAHGEEQMTTCTEADHTSGTGMHRFPAPILNSVDNLSRLFSIFDAVAREDLAALTLERLLDSFGPFESFDPRDGIYAFLSMASDLRGTEWTPDCSEDNTVSKVYAKAASHILNTTNCMDIICRAFLVDSVQGVGQAGHVTYNDRGLGLQMPIRAWVTLPGMKSVGGLDANGNLGERFLRAITGNRRVVDGKVCHIPDDNFNRFKQAYHSKQRPAEQDPGCLADSMMFMVSNSRRFATTENLLGFVPDATRIGDRIAIFLGCSVPVVLREIPGLKVMK
ncbi:ankyrin and het domain protein [Colletotrichum sojae]|uniref:Ankyrin and het domain protein n=1 Tax=Colletotrichum sojae TaxID=2175907 RepID=A0A8H6IS09_9PEZI|nr:ankyrin and het domain protein [Colletotrichum sojae]